MRFLQLLLLTAFFCGVVAASPAWAQPGGGPGGGGPGNPPRSTPGLDPVTLTGIATASYVGFQAFKNRRPR